MKASRYISLFFWIIVANGVMWAGGTTDWICRELDSEYCDDGELLISNTLSAELVVKGLEVLIPEGSDLTPGIFFPYAWFGLYFFLVAGVIVLRRRLHDALVFSLRYVHRKI